MFDTNDNLVRNAKIMMVDDEPLNMEVLTTHLEEEGYSNFVTTPDSVTAFEMVCREQPDVLLLDLIMPDVTGFEILALLRNEEKTKHLPVVVLTSSDDSKTKLKVLKLGATDFLSKPVDASELALRLRNTLAARLYQSHLLNYDRLTGLPSRKLFDSSVKKLYSEAIEKQQKCALMMVNPMRFKAVNDTFGRIAGDSVLISMASRVCGVFGVERRSHRFGDTDDDAGRNQVFRLSGDVIAIVVPMLKDSQEIIALTEKLLSSLNSSYVVDNHDVFINSSIGISVCPSDCTSWDDWVTHAETALFEANQKVESNYLFYDAVMDESAKEYIQIESALRSALPERQLFLVYQPKVDVATDKIIGAEALIRWNHPELGVVSPDLFISLAENSAQIVEIGRWVMEEACKQAVLWHQQGESEFKIAVNVSIRQLIDPGFVDTVAAIVQSSGINPGLLQLELTENMIMDNPENNVKILEDLKSLGVLLSVDDFGTGYSSLSYLQKFPIDELKIDKSFIDEITSPLDRAPIVKAVVSLGHDLGLKLVAEGVETIHQLARLKALKCHIYQGYFCSRPVNVEDFGVLLEQKGWHSSGDLKKAS